MKEFLKVAFDPAKCRKDLDDFRDLLAGNAALEENAHLKPFFESHQQFSAYLCSFAWNFTHLGLLSFQYQLFGDFSCDLVVGDPVGKSYGFIELEDAGANSIFRTQGQKATPEWSSRFERGFSQLVDWFCKLDDMAKTDDFESRFGARTVQHFGLLVIGRDAELSHPRERRRWEWRMRKVLINSQSVYYLTYDQLHQSLSDRLNIFYPQGSWKGKKKHP